MRIVTGKEMAEIDGRAIEELGIPAEALMEIAGFELAKATWQHLGLPWPDGSLAGEPVRGPRSGGRQHPRVIVVAGRGHNGGDGLVAARHLVNRGARVRVYLPGAARSGEGAPDTSPLTGRQLEILNGLGIDVAVVGPADLSKVKLNLAMADVVIDALLGIGFRGEPEGVVASLIDAIDEGGAPVIAADVPSGVPSGGGPVERAVRADVTVTFGLPKLGLMLYPGAAYSGEVRIVDIGFPHRLLEEGAHLWAVTSDDVARWLPPRPADSHKGTYGHVVIVAGSRGMTGAGQLAVRGAHRVGAGLVTWAVPSSLQIALAPLVPEAMTLGLPDVEDATLVDHALHSLQSVMEGKARCAVIGPGLGRSENTAAFVRRFLAASEVPLVIDADALVALADGEEGQRRSDSGPDWVLTPHPGEMARLAGRSVAEVTADPVGVARAVAARYRAVVVLKGARTVTALPDGRAWINMTGNPALATGGTGDVLAGAIGGLIAQGAEAWQAAVSGVYLHGLAADLAAASRGAAGVLAGEVADHLPAARLNVSETLRAAGEIASRR